MKIGELANLADVTATTIRYYESIDLIPPPARTPSGYRDYQVDSLARLRFIRNTQTAGFTLTEIRSFLELEDPGAHRHTHARELVARYIDALDDQIRRLRSTRRELALITSGTQTSELCHPPLP